MREFAMGQRVVIHHQKPWKRGAPITMSGVVESFDGDLLRLVRTFHRPLHKYDGLHARQYPGDHGIIEVHRGGWVTRRRYFRRDGRVIGETFNIQTPARFEPGAVKYVDLEIDVAWVAHRDAKVEIQDIEDLARAEALGYIPRVLADQARWTATELARRLRAWDGAGRLDWDVRPEQAPSILQPHA